MIVRFYRLAALLSLSAMSCGCVSIPEGATATNQAVTTGIERLHVQHRSTAIALAESARQSVYQSWDNEILDRVIANELSRLGKSTLTAPEAAVAAATAADIREALIDQIDAHEKILLTQIDTNYRGVTSINQIVTSYLASAEEVKDARDQLSENLLSTAGVSSEDIPRPVLDLLAISENPQSAE